MGGENANIIARLKKEILPLQGFKSIKGKENYDLGLGPIRFAFPNSCFPLGAMHEFCCDEKENTAATSGFISGILSRLMKDGGACIWVRTAKTIFPPALKTFGIDPEKIIFVDLKTDKDVLWVTEEALKFDGLAAVIAEIRELDFKASRRLQLAVEHSRVTGFIIRIKPKNLPAGRQVLNTTACLTRWRISSIHSGSPNDLPGIGFPRWNVELLKVRNGIPGSWQVEWLNGKLKPIQKSITTIPEEQKKTG